MLGKFRSAATALHSSHIYGRCVRVLVPSKNNSIANSISKNDFLSELPVQSLCISTLKPLNARRIQNYTKMPTAGVVDLEVVDSPTKRQKMEVDDAPVKEQAKEQQRMEEVVEEPSPRLVQPPVMRFSKMSPDALPPERKSEMAAGFDIFSNEEIVIAKRGQACVHTGIKIALPDGCYGRIAPRSGLAVKHSIDVGAGVIDQDYRGEVKVLLFNFSDTDYKVEKGSRIAQLVCERIFIPSLQECETLDETARGEGGFGSTGTK